MTWGFSGRPTRKTCKGYNRPPHECLYDVDFPMHKRTLKNGEVVLYAESLCKDCRRLYNRDLRRMNNKLAGKPGTMGDLRLALQMVRNGASLREAAKTARVGRSTIKKALERPWASKYRTENQRILLNSQPFLEWAESYMAYEGIGEKEWCELVGVGANAISRVRTDGVITIDMAEKFFIHAGYPHLLQVLYDGGESQAA